MCDEMQQPWITLQIGTQVNFPVDNAVEKFNGISIISTSEIQRSDLVIKNKNAVPVDEQTVFIQFLFNTRNKLQPLCKCAFDEVFIDAGNVQINKCLDTVIVIVLYRWWVGKIFKYFQRFNEFFIVLQIEMGTQQVVHAFDIMRGLNVNHVFFLIKQVDPFLRIAIV